MAPMDPQQLLKALNPLLGPTGAILGPTEAVRIASLMKDATKLVSKCIYINILKIETTSEVMEKFLSVSGWDTLNDWLQEAKEEDNWPFLTEVLKVYQLLPVTVEILKKNSAAKTIKQLTKAENENVKTLANNIFESWMKKVKGNNNNNNDSKVKKKKKDKEKDSESKGDSKDEKSDKKDEKDSDRKSSSSDHSKDKSKHRDSKHHHRHSSHHSSRDKDRDRDRDKDREKKSDSDKSKDKEGEESKDEKTGDDVVSVHKGEGLKLTIKIGGDTSPGKGEAVKKRASTVKRPPSKFRSTGLEDQAIPSKIPKSSTAVDTSKPVPKRTGSSIKPELPIKRSRLNMPPPLSVPMTTTVTTPTSASPVSPSEIHGKIKIIPARPRPPNHEIHESSGFMDSLETISRPHGAFKKKRKLSVQGGGSNNGGNGKPPTTPPSPVSPTTAIAKSLPSVPSFYKDTQQEHEPSPDKETKAESKSERSPSPTDNAKEGEATADAQDKSEEVQPAEVRSESPEVKETKGLLTTGATKVKKKKKSVTWKDDSELKEVFYFELDETERENVNRPKDFNQAKKNEMMLDRRAMESARRLINDNMAEQIPWYRPRIVLGHKLSEAGKDSVEKTVQRIREQGVLQALFFRNMLPDGPKEPEVEHEEPAEVKQIPLEDVSGGDEFLYNYDKHAQVVTTKPPPKQPEMSLPQNSMAPPPGQPPMGPPGQPPPLNLPPGVLPPDVMNLLQQFQQNHNPNDPVMSQLHSILNSLMCGGGPDQNFDQLQQIQQIMNSQMGMPPPDGMMQGPPPGMGGPMGPMQGGPPPMGPRGALLGTAPPGFMPQRNMGPNRFPHGPPGNWGQNMGGGPQFNPRMRGPRPRGGAPGNKRRNVLCRHFANGSCRLGSECGFLHPGVNGPPLSNYGEPVENMGT